MAKIVINDFAKKAYKKYIDAGMTPQGACGLMGNQYAESAGFLANRVEFLCIKRLKEKGKKYTDQSYTDAIDSGKITKAEFLNPLPNKQYGFGLSQWTTPYRKSALYSFTVEKGKSIADEDTQLDYVLYELNNTFPKTFNVLKTATSVKSASDYVLIHYESPADVGTTMKNTRSDYGQQYYEYFIREKGTSIGGDTLTQNEAIKKVLSIAENEVGYLEKKSNSNLDSKTENAGSANYTKYWRDVYPEYQAQAWCACFIQWVFMKAFGKEMATKLLKHFPYVYCPTMATLFTLNANPKVGDIVLFYRNGTFAHTGIVTEVSGDKFWTIEGNASGASGITPNGGGVVKKSYYNSQLPGTKFCTPDWSLVSSVTTSKPSTTTTTTSSILKIGSKGDSVKTLQTQLNKLGYGLLVDGEFGTKTDSALRKFQKSYGLVVDGEFGSISKTKLEEVIKKQSTPASTKKQYGVADKADTKVAGTYRTTAVLNMRYIAGKLTSDNIVCVIPKNDKVQCYKYYTVVNGVKWLYVTYENKVGFVSSQYLTKIN